LRGEIRAASQVTGFPFRCDPAFLLQLMKRGIERAITHLQNVRGSLFQALADRPAMERLQCQNLEEQNVNMMVCVT
jgi:hypothetical protein